MTYNFVSLFLFFSLFFFSGFVDRAEVSPPLSLSLHLHKTAEETAEKNLVHFNTSYYFQKPPKNYTFTLCSSLKSETHRPPLNKEDQELHSHQPHPDSKTLSLALCKDNNTFSNSFHHHFVSFTLFFFPSVLFLFGPSLSQERITE